MTRTATTSARTGGLPRAGRRLTVAALVAAGSVPFAAMPAASADPVSTAGRIVYSAGGDIWTMDGDGTDLVQLTGSAGIDQAPTWSPDGTKIAFASTRAGNTDIYVINANGSGETRLTSHTAMDSSPTWSPDGWSIAFTSAREGGTNIFVMNADGTSETPLTVSDNNDAADWSPDGAWIAFQSNRSGPMDLYVMRPDGTGTVRVTPDNAMDRTPTWSPDGQTLVYDRLTVDGRDLYRVARDGTGITQLTSGGSSEERPSVSPDGSRIVYDAAVPGAPIPNARGLVVVDADGSNPVALTDGTTPSSDAEFSPAAAAGPGATPGTATGSTSAGQTLDVAIASPAPGSSVPASSDPFTVTGTAGLSAGSGRPYHAAYVLDVSGSTGSSIGLDCDGSGAFDAVADNFNQDSSRGDILDCEIAAVIALNSAVAGLANATAGVVALGGGSTDATSAALADMSPQTGEQPSTPAGAREPATAARVNVETVLRSMTAGRIGAYTVKTIQTGTNYDAALERMNQHFAGFPSGGTNVAYFLSDGEPNAGTFDLTPEGPLHTAAFRGTRIFTFSVGTAGGGCSPGQPLRQVADRTGGTCAAVVNPEALAAAVSTPASLSAVEVRLDGGTPVAAALDTSTTPATWSAALPGGLPGGAHTLTVTARASDGSSVTATSSVTGLASPVVDAGGPYTVNEGESVALAGVVSDADSPAPDVRWTPADGLTGADTTTPSYAGVDDATETFTLTATDEGGLTGSDTATVETVNVAPALGGVTLEPTPVTGGSFDLRVPFTDPGTQDTHEATIDWGDGLVEPATIESLEAVGTHTYATGGEYTISVTVEDDDGGVGTTEHGPFRVNTAPVVTADGPYAVDEGTPLQLGGSATDPDGDPLTTSWTPSDRVVDPASPTSGYDSGDDAEEILTLTADDGDLASSSQTQVTVRNVAPELGGLTAPTGVVPPGDQVQISATYTDAGTRDTHTATVDWGDGSVETVPATGGALTLSHTYTAGGSWPVTVTLTDDDGGSDASTATIVTNRPPVVDAGADLVLDEGTTGRLAATVTDPDGDAAVLSWSPADAVVDPSAEDPRVEALDDGTVELTLTAVDPHGASASDTVSVQVRNVAPAIDRLEGPASAGSAGETVRVTGGYTDAGLLDTHTARVDWGDGSASDGTAEDGELSAEHSYDEPGIYRVTVEVTDDDGSSASSVLEDVVVVDRDGGFVTGSGHYDSPAGALTAQPSTGGRATVSLDVKYLPGRAAPTGDTQLQVSGLRFTATGYDWLVVDDSTATYQGTGTVAGGGTYAFRVTAVDGKRVGDDVDRIRVEIWDPATGDVLYDSGPAGNGPPTPLRGGSIVLHG